MNNMNHPRTQLELSLENPMKLRQFSQPNRRLSRARWWFQQMHEVVDQALDWSTAPAAPPEQTYLTLAKAR
jgi:hypothetical protein